MGIKITKSRIMADLRQMKKDKVTELSLENETKVREYKCSLISNHKEAINKFVEKNKELQVEYNNLIIALGNDPDIQMYTYSSSSLVHVGDSYKNVESYVINNSYWYRGKVRVFENELYKKETQLENEWDKLITYLSTLTLKDIKKYLEDNNLELPCMKEAEEEETSIAVVNINLGLLFGK